METANRRIRQWIQEGNVNVMLYLSSLGLTEPPVLPPNLQRLRISGNQLTSLPILPDTLLSLSCDNNQLTSLPTLPNTLIDLNCGSNRLESLPILPDTLLSLICDDNQLTSLSTLPNTLRDLNCGSNRLESLPALPNSLQSLKCLNNILERLPALSNSLRMLYCNDNNLKFLPDLWQLVNLQLLYCENNQLTSLPDLPYNLGELFCFNNQLTSLPDLPNRLLKLYCNNNKLKRIYILPNNLNELNLQSNELTTLPKLPINLSILYCGENKLTSLPSLPNSLRELECGSNQLTSLPDLSHLVNLTELYCNNNQLTSLPNLPLNLQKIMIANNKITLTQSQIKFISKQKIQIDIELDIPTYNVSELKCNNDTNLVGDDLNIVNKIIIMLNTSSETYFNYTLYCYTKSELFNTFKGNEEYKYRDNEIYKEPYTGIWMDKISKFYIDLYNVCVLIRIPDLPDKPNSRNLYTLYPVNYKLIETKAKITQSDIINFIPEQQDIDIIYTDNIQISGNKITSDDVEITWNDKIRTDKLGSTEHVFDKSTILFDKSKTGLYGNNKNNFEIFYKENIQKCFMDVNQTYPINHTKLLEWLENGDTSEYKSDWKFKFSESLQHISFSTFYDQCCKVAIELIEYITINKFTDVYIYLPLDSRKSNIWVAMLQWKFLRKYITNIIPFDYSQTDPFTKITGRALIVYCDDCVYSGSQLFISGIFNSLNKNIFFYVSCPYIVDKGSQFLEEKAKIQNINLIFAKSSIIMKEKLERSTFYFDHKLADSVSVYNKLMAGFIKGCTTHKDCIRGYYKTIKYTYLEKELTDLNILLTK